MCRARVRHVLVLCTVAAVLASSPARAATAAPPLATAPRIPLCAGLTVVTAISQSEGDYESIKTIETVGAQSVRLKYSSEFVPHDLLDEPATLQKQTIHRTILKQDLESASLYLQQFHPMLPETVPGTTAIGTSSATLRALKAGRPTDLGIFIAFSQEHETIDRNQHPNVYDNQMVAPVQRVEPNPVPVKVIVNDVPVSLPAIHVAGDYFGDKTEFYFLDDPDNPLTLRYRFGIDSVTDEDMAELKKLDAPLPASRDKDVLQVTKISFHCAAAASTSPAAETPGGALEQALATTGKAEVYDIYFSFSSDQIREESEPSLREIAAVLARHPDWKLAVNGHTDNVGSAAYNLTLSRNRAAAVKRALVERYHVDAARLVTDGFGTAQPQDTNATLEGRARNRRVELVRH